MLKSTRRRCCSKKWTCVVLGSLYAQINVMREHSKIKVKWKRIFMIMSTTTRCFFMTIYRSFCLANSWASLKFCILIRSQCDDNFKCKIYVIKNKIEESVQRKSRTLSVFNDTSKLGHSISLRNLYLQCGFETSSLSICTQLT